MDCHSPAQNYNLFLFTATITEEPMSTTTQARSLDRGTAPERFARGWVATWPGHRHGWRVLARRGRRGRPQWL